MIYQKMGLALLGEKPMASPWGDWVLYILAHAPERFKVIPN